MNFVHIGVHAGADDRRWRAEGEVTGAVNGDIGPDHGPVMLAGQLLIVGSLRVEPLAAKKHAVRLGRMHRHSDVVVALVLKNVGDIFNLRGHRQGRSRRSDLKQQRVVARSLVDEHPDLVRRS
ncbi:hypothetical protein SRABI26_00393 [Arthrobacter sp. Bi26]|nr:hypothetical protein SRABI26_00393 [Arthrobacter sp. Bi26]